MEKWKLVLAEVPPIGKKLWGYDVFYNKIHLCIWDGENRDDRNIPFPISLEENGDDYSIQYWIEVELPTPPNVKMP